MKKVIAFLLIFLTCVAITVFSDFMFEDKDLGFSVAIAMGGFIGYVVGCYLFKD